MIRQASFLAFSSIYIVLSIAADPILDTDESDCILTDTSCACSIKPASGTCLRHQGEGKCLLDDCSDGYRCDCQGFEKCSVGKCSIYTTANQTVVSDVTPFPCQLTPNAGTCINFDSFIDTITAADSAALVATKSVNSSIIEAEEATQDYTKILDGTQEVNNILAELDNEAERVTEEEREQVEIEAAAVATAAGSAQKELVLVQEAVGDAFSASLEASKARRDARLHEKQAQLIEEEVKVEAQKPENKEKCEMCEQLKAEVERLRRLRREQAIAAGTWAKRARDHSGKAKNQKAKVKVFRDIAEQSRLNCIQKYQLILKRLNSGNQGIGSGSNKTVVSS